MDRLSTLDASFLRIESDAAHMHVGWLATLKLPGATEALDVEAVRAQIASRLHLAPRFRRRVQAAPLGEPVWADDPSFDISRHLQVAGGARPLGERALSRVVDGFLSVRLDRARPLWGLLVVPRLAGGRAAVVGKVHHAMVDGIAAVELGALLFDADPGASREEPQAWEPDPTAGPLKLAMSAVTDTAAEQLRSARGLAGVGLAPSRAYRLAETMRRAAFSLAEDALRPAPRSYLNAPITPARTLVTRRVDQQRLDALKRQLGVKLNDVVLAVVTGALRRFAAIVEEQPHPLRAMIPINVRSGAERGQGGNRITFGFLDLPCDEPEALRRVAVIRGRTDELKQSGKVAGSDALLRSASALPGFLKERAARLAASPRMYNLAVSNVPGPSAALYAAGARVESIFPVIPISDGHALSISVLSYRGGLGFSAYASRDALAEAPELGGLLEAAVQELEAAAARRTPRRRARGVHADDHLASRLRAALPPA